MIDDLNGLVSLTKTRLGPAAEVLGRVFLDYPILRYYYAEEELRKKISLSLI